MRGRAASPTESTIHHRPSAACNETSCQEPAVARRRTSGVARPAAGRLALLALLALSGVVAAQIAETRHNLGVTAARQDGNAFGGTSEICVFCHTPHGSDVNAAVPIWNRLLPSPSTFVTYDALGTYSLDGKTAPVGSVSIACLSCHDGVTSMSAVINAPGSGLAGAPDWQAGAWSGERQANGRLSRSQITNLGVDLRNDHPVGIQYGGGGIDAGDPAALPRDPDFKTPASAMLNGSRVWWVDTETHPNGTRQRSDMVLYTRPARGGYAGQTQTEPFVECASCHDPHTANATFLRFLDNRREACLACHSK